MWWGACQVDIEGSEWETFKAMLPEVSLPFGQLLIELHFKDTLEVFNFFDNMDTHGYRIFMRETNHNPCAAGKLPIAVEFSLINPQVVPRLSTPHCLPPLPSLTFPSFRFACLPQLYFSGKPDRASVISIQSRPEPPKYDGVIYVLSKRSNMERLTGMLANLDKNFNQRFKYPVVIFHEDFTEDDKRTLQVGWRADQAPHTWAGNCNPL